MAVTILDIDFNDSVYGREIPPVVLDFNGDPAMVKTAVEKKSRMAIGRLRTYNANAIKAEVFGLRTIRSAVFFPGSGARYKMSGSIAKVGSLNNSVTIYLLDGGTSTYAGSLIASFIVTGDR